VVCAERAHVTSYWVRYLSGCDCLVKYISEESNESENDESESEENEERSTAGCQGAAYIMAL